MATADDPAEILSALVRAQLDHAISGARQGIKVYESLRNLNEVIGTQYSDRVLYELIQNAHDANFVSGDGKIAIKLCIRAEGQGELYVANAGAGFALENVDAIRYLGLSSKEVGDGIGNKGLGFRSVEALTDDARIYSKKDNGQSSSFDGYCFRFAHLMEIEKLLEEIEASASIRKQVAETIPRYLISVPITDPPAAEIAGFARAGYATVVELPLKTTDAVQLAVDQVEALTNLDVPLLLFLDRIAEIRLEIERPDQQPVHRVLRRREERLGDVSAMEGCSLHRVDVGDRHRFLVVRRLVDKEQVIEAVRNSIPAAPQLRRWLNWKGEPFVSVAVSLDRNSVAASRLYNFLPMGEEASAPLAGYLDAPFFTDIDRTSAKLDLPLNNALLTAAAEACAAAALHIVEHKIPVAQESVFDLVAWGAPSTTSAWGLKRSDTTKIENAFKNLRTSLRDAKIVPAISSNPTNVWASLAEVILWPEGNYKALTARAVARRVSSSFVSPRLGSARIERLKYLARTFCRDVLPSSEKLGEIIETLALELSRQRVSARMWSDFYEDTRQVCDGSQAGLKSLAGKNIFIDRRGRIRPAVTEIADGERPVYVRGPQEQRAKTGVPLPPPLLSQRYIFLSERIHFSEDTLRAYMKASLLRQFDPLEAFAGLEPALGSNPNEEKRKAALGWVFELWKSVGERERRALRSVELFVPTRSGWMGARSATFSASWTPIGKQVENYLIEGSDLSQDCKQASGTLLVSWSEWPKARDDTKRDWLSFLQELGVADGLRPLPSQRARAGSPSGTWNSLLRSGDVSQGFDRDWLAEAASVSFNYPYTTYQMRGDGWRLPGQLEFQSFPDSTKRLLSNLIFQHLEHHGTNYFTFGVGRYERHQKHQDARELPTPLAIFIRSKAWIAANSVDDIKFCPPAKCWSTRSRRGGVPRFMNRLSEERAGSASDNDELSSLLFSNSVGLRDWQSKSTALQRLEELGGLALELSSVDRAVFRREYRYAWRDVCESQMDLPTNLTIAISRQGRLESLKGSHRNPPELVVTNDLSRFETKALTEAGYAILDVGEAPLDAAVSALKNSAGFKPISLADVNVQLVVDGTSFVPSPHDPLLVDLGLDWLPQAAVVGHEILGQQLEKAIPSARIEARIRAIRLRRCGRISLLINGQEVSTYKDQYYAFEHDDAPTLILANELSLDWRILARAANLISRLVDVRLRSLSRLISDLVIQRDKQNLEAPTNEDLAAVLHVDPEIIEEHILELRTDSSRLVQLLFPVVAYCGGTELARQFRAIAELQGANFDLEAWLSSNSDKLESVGKTPSEILDSCKRVVDCAELRRILQLDFFRFNRVLEELGEPLISNEEDLRRSYQAYLQELKPDIIDRLRRHYLGTYSSGAKLDQYIERKTLSFLPFDRSWIAAYDSLELELVKAYAMNSISQLLGEDIAVSLRPLERLLDVNRKITAKAVKETSSIVAAWCSKNNRQQPDLWRSGDVQGIVRHLESSGLLDFEILSPTNFPKLCWRAECWPLEMPETINKHELGIGENDLAEERTRREEEQRQAAVVHRTIVFADTPLDTGAGDFIEKFTDIAGQAIESDTSWLDRSSSDELELKNLLQTPGTVGSSGGGTGSWRRNADAQLTDNQRQAMGLAGEWLAYQFLRKRHGKYVNEDCWVSTNRQRFVGGSLGDDAAGFDFCVHTPRVDWFYEVKSTLGEGTEFEITANELRVASTAAKDRSRRYRILYVQHVFSPSKWFVLVLPNPMGEKTRYQFQTIGHGALRLRFEKR